MQDEAVLQIVDQLRAINESLRAIAKRLDRIESAVKKSAGEEELVVLPRAVPTPPAPPPARHPEAPPLIESRVS